MHLTCAGGSSIALADMDMNESIAQIGNRFGRAFLLDIRMERVEHGPEIWMIDLIDQRSRLGGRGEEIAFESVEVFDREFDLGLGRDFRGLPEHFGRTFLLIRRWTSA